MPVIWDNGHVSKENGFAVINRSSNSVARPYVVQSINETFEQEIEIDTTKTETKTEMISSYIINISINGSLENSTFKCQYSGWDEVSKDVSGYADNLDVDLSPASKKEGFTNLGFLDYSRDSLYSFSINRITINGYEFSDPIVRKTLKAALYQNSLPNI